jgi:hypothetical protein
VDFLDNIIKLFTKQPHLLILVLVIGGSIVRAVVQGLTEAKRRRAEVEARREARERGEIVEPAVTPEVPEPEPDWQQMLEMEPRVEPEAPPAPAMEQPNQTAPPAPPPVYASKRQPFRTKPRDFTPVPVPARAAVESTEAAPTNFLFPGALDVNISEPIDVPAPEIADPHEEPVGESARGGYVFANAREYQFWRNAIILNEILATPVSMRPPSSMSPRGADR